MGTVFYAAAGIAAACMIAAYYVAIRSGSDYSLWHLAGPVLCLLTLALLVGGFLVGLPYDSNQIPPIEDRIAQYREDAINGTPAAMLSYCGWDGTYYGHDFADCIAWLEMMNRVEDGR